MSDDRDDHQRQQDRAMAVVFRGAQWLFDDIAHALPVGAYTAEQWNELQASLEMLAMLVEQRTGRPFAFPNRPATKHEDERHPSL